MRAAAHAANAVAMSGQGEERSHGVADVESCTEDVLKMGMQLAPWKKLTKEVVMESGEWTAGGTSDETVNATGDKHCGLVLVPVASEHLPLVRPECLCVTIN